MNAHHSSEPEGLGVTAFGVGGAGGNAVAALLRRPHSGMKIICAHTDTQALQTVPPANRLQLGRLITAGLGAGARPEIGRAAAEEAMPEIDAALDGTALCFIAAGLCGGTGAGAAPVIARAARARGILTIAVATKPLASEGKARARAAEKAAADLAASVDVMVMIDNQKLFESIGREATPRATLDVSDSIFCETATDIVLLLGDTALKRVGLADVRALLGASGHAVIGYGEACAGGDRALEAARSALSNPLLEGATATARRLLVTVAGSKDLALFEVEEAIAFLRTRLSPEVELVWGAAIDPALAGQVRVGLVAAGLSRPSPAATRAPYILPAARRAAVAVVRRGPALLPAPPAQPSAKPHAQAPRQLAFALDFPTRRYAETIDPRVLAVVPRSAVTPSLSDRVYRAARAVQRRWRTRRKPVAAPNPARAPGSFQILKAFDPPRRQPPSAGGPLVGLPTRTIVIG